MTVLVFKKWYQKSHWAFDDKFDDIHSLEVEGCNCELCSQTEKAIACNHIQWLVRGKSVSKIYFPKSALIVMEKGDENHFEEMNKVENKEVALKEVNDYLNEVLKGE